MDNLLYQYFNPIFQKHLTLILSLVVSDPYSYARGSKFDSRPFNSMTDKIGRSVFILPLRMKS